MLERNDIKNIMNIFNYQQKVAMMRILLDIIQADGRIDAREIFNFNPLLSRLEIIASKKAQI